MPTTKGAEPQRVYMSVVGHSRHAESLYKLVVIAPTADDISKYQVSQSEQGSPSQWSPFHAGNFRYGNWTQRLVADIY